jgi:ATP-dependent helicase YprA (DUF1998 family)
MNEQELLENFYKNFFAFSYSSLNKLLYAPVSFYNWYVLQQKEDKLESYLIEGKVIHCLLLDESNFDSQFTVLPGNIPTATSKKVVEGMYVLWKELEWDLGTKLQDCKTEILEWLVIDDTYQKLVDDKDMSKPAAKTGDEKRLAKILNAENEEYFQYLQRSGTKDVIDIATKERCNEAVEILKNHDAVKKLLCLEGSGFELVDVYNEQPIEIKKIELPFGFKGIIDNFVVDHQSKTISINDLKTSSKSLSEFQDSIDYFKYWLQAALYVLLVKTYLTEQGINVEEYTMQFHFIVIDKYNQVYPFKVRSSTLQDWSADMEEVIEKAKYHYISRDYTLPYEFATGQVEL